MPQTCDHLLLRAIRKERIERTPVWIMRQAGRYLPEYISLKNRAGGFIKMVKNPDIACEITMQPIKRFSLDCAIVFSDILVISDMFGIELSFEENKGPRFDKTIRSETDLKKIKRDYDVEDVNYVFDAISKIKSDLNNEKPLIGFIGSPWTVATYFIEGNSTKVFDIVKNMMRENKVLLQNILEEITSASIKYINQQIIAGIDVVMIFDTWGGLLNTNDFSDLSIKYVNKIRESLVNPTIPVIYYTREPQDKIEVLRNLNVDVIGIDSSVKIGEFRKALNDKFAIQGNLDKEILKLNEDQIFTAVDGVLNEYGCNTGHIFNLGTGITPDIQPEKVECLLNAVEQLSPQYNQR